jgi:hypothetical protein
MNKESLKLKVEYRPFLYYKKYQYKASIKKISGLYWFARKSLNLEEYETHYKNLYSLSREQYDKETIETILDIIGPAKNKNAGYAFRIETNNLSLFHNDLDALIEFTNRIGKKACFFQVVTCDFGVIKFKNTPPANYRIFFNGNIITNEEKRRLYEYVKKSVSIKPSYATEYWLTKEYSWSNTTFAHKNLHLNIDDEKTMMLLYLTFPNIMGKSYRLEMIE